MENFQSIIFWFHFSHLSLIPRILQSSFHFPILKTFWHGKTILLIKALY